jgi:hypothetical protein
MTWLPERARASFAKPPWIRSYDPPMDIATTVEVRDGWASLTLTAAAIR